MRDRGRDRRLSKAGDPVTIIFLLKRALVFRLDTVLEQQREDEITF